MSGKYYRLNSSSKQDLTAVLEPQVYTAAAWCDSYFKNEPFQKPGADTDTTNVTISTSHFKYGSSGTALKGVAKGYFPTVLHQFAALEIAGNYTFTRSDSAMTFKAPDGTTGTVPASSFRNGVVPKEIIIVLVGGGGGGGGGCTYYKYAKDDYRRTISGAGGGGGVCLGRIELPLDTLFVFEIGAGGGPGTHGASGGENPGTAGGSGEATYFGKSASNILIAYGGVGGAAGPKSDGSGTGGSGGTFSYNSPTELKGVTGMNGGQGNYYNNHNKTGTADLSAVPVSVQN